MNYLIIIIDSLFVHTSLKEDKCSLNNELELDRRIQQIHQKLDLDLNDTLVIYRHQIQAGEQYGYCRLIKKSKSVIQRKDLSFSEKSKSITESLWYEISDSTFFSIYPKINPILDSIEYPGLGFLITHFTDGLHTLQIHSGSKQLYCRELYELELVGNQFNSQNKLLFSMRDTLEFSPVVKITVRELSPLYYIDEKPVFHVDPKINRKLRKEYFKKLKEKK